MQSLIRSKSAGVTGGRGTAGAGPGRDLLYCSPSCFDPDSLLLAYLWLGLSWIDCISANKNFSSSKTSSRKPYTSSKQQERQKHSVEITINFSGSKRQTVSAHRQQPRAVHPVRRAVTYKQKGERRWIQGKRTPT